MMVGLGHHGPLQLMAVGYHPLIPSAPRPLRPSVPVPDPDHQASLHYHLLGGPMQWEMVMRQGYERTIGYEQVSAWYYHSF